jgi:hypothetical protein
MECAHSTDNLRAALGDNEYAGIVARGKLG